jgi:8-amino-7-oxononanoate synthase
MAMDFTSKNTLSPGASGALREEFDKELSRYSSIPPGAGSSIVMDGNYSYVKAVECEIAKFHGADSALFLSSGNA